jgi:hypothetical protein
MKIEIHAHKLPYSLQVYDGGVGRARVLQPKDEPWYTTLTSWGLFSPKHIKRMASMCDIPYRQKEKGSTLKPRETTKNE